MMIIRRIMAGVLAVILLAALWSAGQAQGQGYEYFPETGHSLQGSFFAFYRSIQDPITIYGYPITEEFTSRDGAHVQYFQRARFEYHPEIAAGQQVHLTNLGRAMSVPAAQLNTDSPFACRYFPSTNYSVCFAFLDFFDQFGGVAQFGYPISPFEYHDGLIVQYFEKARMEWQPSQPAGQRVVLSDLGRLYFDKLGEDPGYLQPVTPLNGAPSSVISLQVKAFVWKAMTFSNDKQLVFLIVQDQRAQPVAGASCGLVVHWLDGRTEQSIVTTNPGGVAIAALNVVNQPYGNLVYIDVNCGYGGLTKGVTTAFRIWY